MIPKVIHFCWLSGDPYPPLVVECLASWKKYLPDYEIRLWSRETFEINSVSWVKEAFECKRYAFAADYIRFYALYNFGGIYLDADVEVLKSFNPLLNEEYFLGEEASGDTEAAVIGAEKGMDWVKYCLDYYDGRKFIKKDGTQDTRPVPLLLNEAIKKFQLRRRNYTFFSPKDYNIGKIDVSEDTYCIHHFDGKWVKKGFYNTLKRNIHKIIYMFLGREGHNKLIKMIRPLINHI